VKSVCQALGVARSNVHALRSRPTTWVDGRTGRTPRGDSELLAEIREQIADLPSYGYRRACALVNQQRPAGTPRVNPKRAYRVMAGNGLLLPKAPTRPRSSRPHNGTVAVRRATPAGAPTASRSSATPARPSLPPSPRTAATGRSWPSVRGRARGCPASRCARC